MKMILVLAPTLGLVADVASHLLVTWLLRGLGVYVRLACGTAMGAVVGITISLFASMQLGLSASDVTASVLFNVITYLILAFGYFNLVQMNLSSLRLRIANELIDTTDGVPVERLFEMYDSRSIVDARLTRLARGGRSSCVMAVITTASPPCT